MRVLLILFVSLFFCDITMGQEQKVSREQLEAARQDVDFSKTKTVSRMKKNLFKNLDQEQNTSQSDLDFFSSIFEIIGYVLLFLLLGVLVYFISKELKKTKTPIEAVVDLDAIEDIQQVDLDSYLTTATMANDYRLILRIKFLKILKLLASQEKIIWKKHKTNRIYTREMYASEHSVAFGSVTTIFDRIWYGVDYVSSDEFIELEPSFDNLLDTLSNEK